MSDLSRTVFGLIAFCFLLTLLAGMIQLKEDVAAIRKQTEQASRGVDNTNWSLRESVDALSRESEKTARKVDELEQLIKSGSKPER